MREWKMTEMNRTGIMLAYFINFGINKNFSDLNPLQWRIPFALQMVPGVLLLVGMLTQNESPRWLIEKDQHAAALAALSRVRRKQSTDPSVILEFNEIIDDFRGKERLSLKKQIKLCVESRATTYAVSMAVILQFWQQWTGTNSINYYSPQIFKSVGLTGTSAGLFATGIYGVVKVVMTGLGLAFATEQIGRKWCLIVGGIGQAFAMFYIGVNSAVHPVKAGQPLDGNSIFAIISIYLFVVFYSFGWGPIPYVLSSECSPNHLRSLAMALALMMQWLMNFVISKITPYLLADITYGTFLLFGACCVGMTVYAVVCVPETKGVPLEQVHLLFDGAIIKGCIRDTIPRLSRAREWRMKRENEDAEGLVGGKDGEGRMIHVQSAST